MNDRLEIASRILMGAMVRTSIPADLDEPCCREALVFADKLIAIERETRVEAPNSGSGEPKIGEQAEPGEEVCATCGATLDMHPYVIQGFRSYKDPVQVCTEFRPAGEHVRRTGEFD